MAKKCRKFKHATYQAACAHIASLRKKFGPDNVELSIYRCQVCENVYHVGRNPRQAVQNVLRLIDEACRKDRAKRNGVDNSTD